tara:strand:- start:266 stop:637 length:372 start_codon:yes stop_codon:yes gene_type:complete
MAGESGSRRYSSEDENIMFGRDRTPPHEMPDTEVGKKAAVLNEIRELGGRASTKLSVPELQKIRDEIKKEVGYRRMERRSDNIPDTPTVSVEHEAISFQPKSHYSEKKYAHGGGVRKTKLNDY